jgi:hypothetical protein
MENRPNKDLIRETHQAVFGVPGTEEKGISGDIKEIKDLIVAQNGRYRKLSNRVWYLYGALGIGGGGAGIFGLIKLVS